MSQTVVYSCDGPSCMEAQDEASDDSDLMEAGWITAGFADEETEQQSHFCSFACLAAWAAEEAREPDA